MSKPRISSELNEAAALLGAIAEDVRRRASPLQGRGERLQRVLAQLCARARFKGAAVADAQGLPLATHNLPLAADAIGAIASVLGGALTTVGRATGHPEAASITVELGLDQKLVVRRIAEGDPAYFLVVLCPLGTDERSEIELSLRQLGSLVGRGS